MTSRSRLPEGVLASARIFKSGQIEPGSRLFSVVLAMAMAVTALSIGAILPTLPAIRGHFGLPADSAEVSGLVTSFFLGNSLGLLPAGVLADKYGRRPVMQARLVLYVLGAAGSVFAPSLNVMLLARFVWGLGAAGPRVAAMAIVRDAFDGEEMARQLSTMMVIFVVVPAVGPSLTVAILAVSTWQAAFWAAALGGTVVLLLSTGLARTYDARRLDFDPSTMRAPLVRPRVLRGCLNVMRAPRVLWYVICLSSMFTMFFSYLGASELILEITFRRGPWFPVFFGALALLMGAATQLNRKLILLVGVDRSISVVLRGFVVCSGMLLILSLLTSGRPPFMLFTALLVP